MVDPARNLALIPARGGSKRLPRKNLLHLGGKPLILHSVDVAVQSGCFGKVIVSSDDSEIRAAAEAHGGAEVDLRDEALAGDRIKVVDVVAEMAERPEVRENYDTVTLLLPTAPFRRASDIRAGFDLLTPDLDAVISFTDYEFPPQFAVTLDPKTGGMKPFIEPSPLLTNDTRSQDQASVYRPNGGFFILWLEPFLKLRSFYRGRVGGYVMPRLHSVDIDEEADLLYAQFLIDSGQIVLGQD